MGRWLTLLRVLTSVFLTTGLWAHGTAASNLTVDLGYGIYTGVANSSTGLNIWKGIQYAAAPVGALRWQAPQTPATNRTVVLASEFGPYCPQSLPAVSDTTLILGDEDCLYLNVYASASLASGSTNSTGLPVLVSIHGGGYGEGSGQQDMSAFVNANDNDLIAVTIQYRLGAFGFAASPEIKSKGVLNAGLLDQNFALQWVQQNIAKFGGDPNRVTIAGESSGGGSVMLHAMAQNGTLGTKLFENIIAASPYLPTQPSYNDSISIRHYTDFAKAAGCTTATDVFDCLVSQSSMVLQYASNLVSTSAPTPYGNWAFIPVTDGTYVVDLPSIQLYQRRVNGLRLLAGNNANEGALMVPTTISTQDDLIAWISSNYPNLSATNVTQVLAAYPSTPDPVNPADPKYETDGYGPATAVNVSQAGTGQQQRAYDIYGETAAVCPSYWMATAFTSPDHVAYHYQYSVPFAIHGSDVAAYYGPPTANQGPDFVTAFQKIYGNFIINGNPSIDNSVANGAASSDPNATNPASAWPTWTDTSPMQMNLNETGGTPYKTLTATGIQVTQFKEPGLQNSISLVPADSWEGNRGQRCEFWRTMGPFIPQ